MPFLLIFTQRRQGGCGNFKVLILSLLRSHRWLSGGLRRVMLNSFLQGERTYNLLVAQNVPSGHWFVFYCICFYSDYFDQDS